MDVLKQKHSETPGAVGMGLNIDTSEIVMDDLECQATYQLRWFCEDAGGVGLGFKIDAA